MVGVVGDWSVEGLAGVSWGVGEVASLCVAHDYQEHTLSKLIPT
jgi:hypothetical protein